MAHEIRIRKAEGTWVVRGGGAILAESTSALELDEEGHEPVIYFPRSDVATAFLEPSPTQYHCPRKGDASHYALQTKSVLIPDVAWSYEQPKDGAREIAGHLAFYGDKVAVEQI